MKRLCIIPARGGSKRIPRKNCKDFLGRPIISYSIKTALDSQLFDEVMVSTDDEEIKEIAEKYGAKTPWQRSAKNANDYATTFDVIEEVISNYKNEGAVFSQACCLYATAPLVTVHNLEKSFLMLNDMNFTTVFPVIRFGFPIQRALTIGEANKMELLSPEHETSRSQDLVPSFHDAGQFYTFNVDQTLRSGKLYTANSGVFEVPENEAQDIDNEIDWKMAELKYRLQNNLH